MATAGASALAAACGLRQLVVPLLVLAILQAFWIPLMGAWRHRSDPHLQASAILAIGPAHRHSGIHTVPLGLAVIASGVIALGASAGLPWTGLPAFACLALAWLLTVACIGRFFWSLATRGLALATLDGAWFLVPAALLGVGIATQALADAPGDPARSALGFAALAASLLGWAGYWLGVTVTLVRVRRYGLGGVPQAPWWIAMGCAGLAAAALGRTAQDLQPGSTTLALQVAAMAATCIFAVALAIPVLAGSMRFLRRQCCYREMAVWPPTFSTAVFALGCLQTGEILQSAVFRNIGLGAGYATLVLWGATAGWNTKCMCVSRLRQLAQRRSL